MPSLTYTPGALSLTGAEINPAPVRFTFTSARLAFAGGDFSIGVDLVAAADGNRLPRLRRQQIYFEKDGTPTAQFQQFWQGAMERIEQRFSDIEGVLALIQTAQATAATAVQTANATQASLDLTNSYTNPVGVLTAASSGVVTVAAHTRVYGNGTQVAVTGGSLSGFAAGDYLTIYYSDPARTGGAVAYQGTTSAVSQTGSTHVVGQVVIPAAGAADTVGSGPTAPGYTAPTDPGFDTRDVEYAF